MDRRFRVLVLGDVMLDSYVFVSTERMCQEAPIPVWDEVRRDDRLGGAANVAHNIKILGKDDVDVYLAGVVGLGKTYDLLRGANIDTTYCFAGSSMIKRRYVDERSSKIIARFDNIKKIDDSSVEFFELMVNSCLDVESFDIVVVSDYDKGSITERLARRISRESSLSIVDSKRKNLLMYGGFTIVKMNENEASVQTSVREYTNFESLFQYCIVTKGSNGAELRQCRDHTDSRYVVDVENFSTKCVKAKDVTGCGDTHTAALAYFMLRNRDVRLAIAFANEIASGVVTKFGTSVPDDLNHIQENVI